MCRQGVVVVLTWLSFASLASYGIGKDVAEGRASTCDAVFTSDKTKNSTFSSPQYPNPYPPRSRCRYNFEGRGKERIQIVFHDFNLYHPSDDAKECDSIDSVNAYVNIDGRMEKMDTFCGSVVPKPLMSNGPRLSLEFNGLYSTRHVRGFKASYIFTENFGITTGKQLSEFPCAFAFHSNESRNGTFASPNFPGFYPRDTECHYFFHGEPREKVHIHFTYFDVEGVAPCEAETASDYVEFSNFFGRDRKYSRYCGQRKDLDVESDRKFFKVTFRSNDRLDGTGFNATYQFLDEVDSYSPKPTLRNCSSTSSSIHFLLSFMFIILLRSLAC